MLLNKIDRINEEYFEWLKKLVCGTEYTKIISFDKLLLYLHNAEFRWSVPLDANRAQDGIDLRFRFAPTIGCHDILDYLYGPCSVLEMMIALAVKCEETIMDDPRYGDRTGQWFWDMVVSLGLGSQIDTRFDEGRVEMIVNRFLDREYEPNGKGGLFTLDEPFRDMRDIEIWYQACDFINSIV